MTPSTGFVRRLVSVVLLLVPVGYLAQLFATLAHEVLGHGLATILVGGQFHGFALAWDGMGSADVTDPAGATVAPLVWTLVAGVTSTCMLGLLLLGVSSRLRNGPTRWAVLVFSATMLLEGAPYAFWNAWHVKGPGDIGRIIRLVQDEPDGHAAAWRCLFLVVGGALTVLGTLLPLGRLLRDVDASFPDDPGQERRRRTVLASAFALGGTGAWFLFDWDQLVPGVGLLPPITGSALVVATAARFVLRRTSTARPSESVAVGPLVLAGWWLAAGLGMAAALLLLGRGVHWG